MDMCGGGADGSCESGNEEIKVDVRDCVRCSVHSYLPIMPIIAFPVNSGEYQYVDRIKSYISAIWGKCQYWHFPQMPVNQIKKNQENFPH